MRLLIGSLAVACCISGTALAQDDEALGERVTIQVQAVAKEQIRVDGETLNLAYEGASDGDTIKEFIPSDQTLETWTRLAAVREYANLDSPEELAAGVVNQLKQRNPPANYELLENPDSQDIVLDFIVWPEDGAFAEFNVFLYRKRDEGGLVMYQYALRGYGDQAEEMIKSMDADKRAKLIAATAEFASDKGE